MIGAASHSTVLQRRGKDPTVAGRVGEVERNGTPALLFHFPRAGDLLVLPDKEASLSRQLGSLQLDGEFWLKGMQCNGQVSL